jgi:hypothetical protein
MRRDAFARELANDSRPFGRHRPRVPWNRAADETRWSARHAHAATGSGFAATKVERCGAGRRSFDASPPWFPKGKIAQRRNKRRGLYAKSARRRMPSPLRVQARAGCARR